MALLQSETGQDYNQGVSQQHQRMKEKVLLCLGGRLEYFPQVYLGKKELCGSRDHGAPQVSYLLLHLEAVVSVVPVVSVELTILVLVSLTGVDLDLFRPFYKFFVFNLHEYLGYRSVERRQYQVGSPGIRLLSFVIFPSLPSSLGLGQFFCGDTFVGFALECQLGVHSNRCISTRVDGADLSFQQSHVFHGGDPQDLELGYCPPSYKLGYSQGCWCLVKKFEGEQPTVKIARDLGTVPRLDMGDMRKQRNKCTGRGKATQNPSDVRIKPRRR
ncbi:hypothetical protein Acr_20g0009040 [Actinidia rufa]|uniref:Uncharacterized protein n=1 Tax=Actinidia rufa TaxID=165716 RepID=A0A7J0GE54_9ERIC|nr:hypothetical protein Acr_20g0009040 [Actinidia rufa]